MTYRGLEAIGEARLLECLARTPMDQYVLWTGGRCEQRSGSLRARALNCVSELGAPVSLRCLIRRAARLDGSHGLSPDLVRSAVRLHQSARPSAFFLLRRTCSGDYVAVTDIPWPAGGVRPVAAGDVVMTREGKLSAGLGLLTPAALRPAQALEQAPRADAA